MEAGHRGADFGLRGGLVRRIGDRDRALRREEAARGGQNRRGTSFRFVLMLTGAGSKDLDALKHQPFNVIESNLDNVRSDLEQALSCYKRVLTRGYSHSRSVSTAFLIPLG